MDMRNINTGSDISSGGYSDQPYIVKTSDGAWLMCVTTGSGLEGQSGQHVVTARSTDRGRSWADDADVESADKPESSYAVMYKCAYGRIYCFYNYNADDLREVIADSPYFKNGLCSRVDTQGHFVFKYSDDCGKSWSEKYYDIPMRRFNVDLNNPYGGKILYFWNVGRPFSIDGGVYVPIYKIRGFGEGFMYDSEGALLYCADIENERDPEKLVWQTLPDGDEGIKAPRSLTKVSEEHSFVTLSDGGIFCVFRTTTSHPYCAYSRDGGHTFTQPAPLAYADGRLVKHPRAANFIWKCENGKYLYWFHNHGGNWYDGRNPVWIMGAVEYAAEDGIRLKFSQPEVLLYSPDRLKRMSYPDFVEENTDGEYYFTETEKNVARVHKADGSLIRGLWEQFDNACSAHYGKDGYPIINGSVLPSHEPFVKQVHTRGGNYSEDTGSSFAIAFTLNNIPESDTLLISNKKSDGSGIEISWNSGKIEFYMCDGQCAAIWDTTGEEFSSGRRHIITVIVDGGARLIEFVADGRLLDGGEKRQNGWGRFDRYMLSVGSSVPVTVDKAVSNAEYFKRFMTVSEAVSRTGSDM